MAIQFGIVAAFSAIAGVVSHLGYFIRGEHMLTAYRLVTLALFGPPAVVALLTSFAGLSFSHAAALTSVSYGAYMVALFTSILIYRAFFHPLRHFAGPRLARLSQFYHFFRIRAKVDNYRHLDRLHDQYGEYVRVGPNLLSISDPDMIEVIFHSQSNFTKAECWYPAVLPFPMRFHVGDMPNTPCVQGTTLLIRCSIWCSCATGPSMTGGGVTAGTWPLQPRRFALTTRVFSNMRTNSSPRCRREQGRASILRTGSNGTLLM